MRRYEFKVVPAPRRGEKAKGVKTTEERFALAMANLMNKLGAEGWDYVRSDTLRVEEKSGWARRATIVENTVLVFRREIDEEPTYAAPYGGYAEPVVSAPVLKSESAADRVQREAREQFTDLPLTADRAEPRFAARREPLVETGAPRLGPARGEQA